MICAVLLRMEWHSSGSMVGTHFVCSVFLVPWQLQALVHTLFMRCVRCRARAAVGLRQRLAQHSIFFTSVSKAKA